MKIIRCECGGVGVAKFKRLCSRGSGVEMVKITDVLYRCLLTRLGEM